MKRFAPYVVAGALTLGAAGCDDRNNGTTTPPPTTPPVTGEDVKQKVGEAAETIGQFAAQTKDEAVAKASEQWTKLQAEYAAWKVSAADASAEAKAAMQAKMDAAGDELAKLKESTGEAWKDIMQGVKNAYSQMSKALKDAKDEFKKDDTPAVP